MQKVALVVAYFGPLPKYTGVFFETLKRNRNVDLLLITDQNVVDPPKNVKVCFTTFEQLKARIQSKFDFPITLDRPYKLCDYKPAYGYIFEEELATYDFWGHCDLDMVLGDLNKFLPENIYKTYDKIYELGHLCLYRNTPQNNRRFMESAGMDYKEVFTTPIICVFDEIMGMQKKYELLGIPAYTAKDCADISPWHYTFQRAGADRAQEDRVPFNCAKQVFFWEDGHIYRAAYVDGEIRYDEFNYLHFQKRCLTFVDKTEVFPQAFFCARDGFIPKEPGFNVTEEMIGALNGYHWFEQLKARLRYHTFIFKRRFKKYVLKK